jgi:Doubled CXXCH motif (Paired_CXXCH_1)
VSKLHHFPSKITAHFIIFALFVGVCNAALATIVSNVQATKHNLSAAVDGTGDVPLRGVKAASESQVCVFCHTPHAANQSIEAPLWNRSLSGATYTPYTSSSMDAISTQPTGDSKLCLSCHDGTLAIGTVGVLNGKGVATITMGGLAVGGFMPVGAGATTGFTRNIGIDLSNDHPISFPYNTVLGGTTGTDGELRSPPVVVSGINIVANSGIKPKPIFPLQSDQVQCTTCHDPHLTDTVTTNSPLKFLRGNRLQILQPLGGLYFRDNDIMCLACHEKAGEAWAYSAHANELVADEAYQDSAANIREFARGTTVWQASCLNCHDSHSVEGSRRLLREGTNSSSTPKSGGLAAGEENCYQCHSLLSASILDSIAPTNKTPDIQSDFNLTYRMPISLQPEVHNIGGNFDDTARGGPRCNAGDQCGKDFVESQLLLGKVSAGIGGTLNNRHAECTDCHNPHRATKNRLFNGNAINPDEAGTHKHNIVAGDVTPHNNLASGSLRGTFGVEPIFLSSEFNSNPVNFDVKRGDGGINAITTTTSTYVTREYQVCLKCHSNYGFDNHTPPPLPLSSLTGGTKDGTNGVKYYSDVAMEFQAPISHQGLPANGSSTADSSGAVSSYSTNNHRSWHPVMAETGRTAAAYLSLIPSLTISPNLLRAPWNGSNLDGAAVQLIANAVGTQTMQCGDCHGATTILAEGVVPAGGDVEGVWGPHGSNDDFILKGKWYTDAPNNHAAGSDNLCFRCHEESQYADATGTPTVLTSGFSDMVSATPIPNLHQRHAYLTTQGGTLAPSWPPSENGSYRCTMCHTGTAHGWKNKAFLTNLNDLGPEVLAIGGEVVSGVPATTLLAGDPVPKGTVAPAGMSVLTGGYSNGPYYRGSMLSITAFKAPGTWVKTDCGTSGCHF